MKHLYLKLRYAPAVLLITLLVACSPPPPTTNPVRSLDAEQFHQIITDKAFSGLVAVFASWCPPCREELPELARLYREQKPEGAQIIAASMEKGDVKEVQRVVNELGLPFPVYYVGETLGLKYRIIGVPTLMVVRQGKIVEMIPGQQSPRELAAKLKATASGGS